MSRAIISERLPAPVVLFSYPPVHDSHLLRLRRLGLKVYLLSDVSQAPHFGPGDVLLVNTVGFTPSVRHEILDALERKRIRKVLWYIHEDEPSLQFCPVETRRIRRLMKRGSMVLITPAHHICEQYYRHFDLEIVREPYRIHLPEAHHARRAPHDFDTLRFVLPGSFGDGPRASSRFFMRSLPFTRRNSRAIQSCTAISALLSSAWRKIFSRARFGSTRTYSVTG